jgi:hypothetical protein
MRSALHIPKSYNKNTGKKKITNETALELRILMVQTPPGWTPGGADPDVDPR